MPDNVLYVSHTSDLKGSAVSLFQLMSGLDGSRYTPVAVFSKDGPMVENATGAGIRSFVLKERGPLGLCLIRRARALIREEGIRLVHLNSAVPFCKYIGIAARLCGVPVVWHLREDPEGKRIKRLGKWVRLLSARILVVSSDLYDAFGGTGMTQKVYNGVNTALFSPETDGSGFRDRFGIPEGAFVFGMVGTVEERKANMPFLEAARTVAKDFENVRFVIVGGPGDADYIELVKRFAQGSPELSGKVVMTGKLSNIPEVMAGMDVLVMPSLWEGFSRALIEAMASGKPAIASDVGETRYILDDGVNGFLVPPGGGGRLAGVMSGCLTMGDRLAEFGKSARNKALGFSIERHVAEVQGIYGEILGGREISPPHVQGI